MPAISDNFAFISACHTSRVALPREFYMLIDLGAEISGVIHQLTQGLPDEQKEAIETYFLEDASFIHPLCRVPAFAPITLPVFGKITSRWFIWMIFRFYKILSPRIWLEVECYGKETPPSPLYLQDKHVDAFMVELQKEASIMFISIHQIFAIWFVPFYEANVHLTTKLQLQQLSDKKHYIKLQEDLYQVNDLIKFFVPFGASALVWVFQVLATFVCTLGALIFAPFTWYQQETMDPRVEKARRPQGNNGPDHPMNNSARDS